MTAGGPAASPVTAAFRGARAEGRAALVGYLPAGYPTIDWAVRALEAMVEAGVDIVEVGLPYSDPLMDGPTIQQAVESALRSGTTTRDVLRTVEQVASNGTAVLVMSYWNPIERYGPERFARDLASVGGAGVITPDLIPDEAAVWLPAAREHGGSPPCRWPSGSACRPGTRRPRWRRSPTASSSGPPSSACCSMPRTRRRV